MANGQVGYARKIARYLREFCGTTNQGVGSSNLSGRANFSYRDNVLARFTSPTRRRNQVVARLWRSVEYEEPGPAPLR